MPDLTEKAQDDVLLRVDDLHVRFTTDAGVVRAVDGLSFDVRPGEIVGIVGESGSGKSVASKALLGLHTGSSAHVSGRIVYRGDDLVSLDEARLRRYRGAEIAMIFQDPLSSLHPYFTVGRQVAEAYRVHHDTGRRQARDRAIEMLDLVGLPDPRRGFNAFPHQFSGGMRQRVMIAMALVNEPRLLIADEPTTALDVTVQAQILDLVVNLSQDLGSAVILVTHDLGVIAETCDRVLVLYAGRCVEQATVTDLFQRPQMPYTWGLLRSMPRLDVTRAQLDPIDGQPPSLTDLPPGCVFAPRCAYRDQVPDDRCTETAPELEAAGPDGHYVRCHLDPEPRAKLWSTEVVST